MIAALGWTLIGEVRPILPIIYLTGLLTLVAFVDDVRGLPIWVRGIIQAALAILLVCFYPASPFLNLVVVVTVIWVTNLYNFMDGIDGLAGGMTAIGFGFLSVAAASSSNLAMMTISICVSSASFGFMLFNFPPAKVFMGDAGAIPCGFLAAALGYYGYYCAAWPLWVPFFIFSPFLYDATTTLLRRLLRRENIWQAHRGHLYQRMALKLGHKGTTLSWYGVMLCTGACALYSQNLEFSAAVICGLGVALFLASLALVAGKFISMTQRDHTKIEKH